MKGSVANDDRVFLLPGELYVSREPAVVSTILGSCVSVCLFNKRLCFGGINHFLHPRTHSRNEPSPKFGDYSTRMLVDLMRAHDPSPGSLEATIVGGGNVLGAPATGGSIGSVNVLVANEVMAENKIHVVRRVVAGDCGRKIRFDTRTGVLDICRIERSLQTREIQRKKTALSQRKIRVLIVDDSRTVCRVLRTMLSGDPLIEVIGEAHDAYEAREKILEDDPDVICLDIIMPKIDGITFLQKLTRYMPKPVVVISTVAQKGGKVREQAFANGAVDVVDKGDLNLYHGPDKTREMLRQKIKMAASVWVGRGQTR